MAEHSLILLDGANELTGPRSLWWMIRHWPALRRSIIASPGYVHHRAWFVFPFTVGLSTWWETEKDAYGFARNPVHMRFWRWAHATPATNGGWLAIYKLEHGGPLWGNGVRAMMRPLAPFVDAAPGTPVPPVPGAPDR